MSNGNSRAILKVWFGLFLSVPAWLVCGVGYVQTLVILTLTLYFSARLFHRNEER